MFSSLMSFEWLPDSYADNQSQFFKASIENKGKGEEYYGQKPKKQ